VRGEWSARRVRRQPEGLALAYVEEGVVRRLRESPLDQLTEGCTLVNLAPSGLVVSEQARARVEIVWLLFEAELEGLGIVRRERRSFIDQPCDLS
jgi:hypothetical protein